jgi:hypothetical protein
MPLVERTYKGRRQWSKGDEGVRHLDVAPIALVSYPALSLPRVSVVRDNGLDSR